MGNVTGLLKRGHRSGGINNALNQSKAISLIQIHFSRPSSKITRSAVSTAELKSSKINTEQSAVSAFRKSSLVTLIKAVAAL